MGRLTHRLRRGREDDRIVDLCIDIVLGIPCSCERPEVEFSIVNN